MISESKRKSNKKYYKNHKEHLKELHNKWQKENLDKVREYNNKWRAKNPDKAKEYARRSYERHKTEIALKQKKYREENRAKITQTIVKRRKEVAEELKAKGQIWTYLPKTARENKMVKSLANRMGIDEITSRAMLEEHEWNYKALIEENFNEC